VGRVIKAGCYVDDTEPIRANRLPSGQSFALRAKPLGGTVQAGSFERDTAERIDIIRSLGRGRSIPRLPPATAQARHKAQKREAIPRPMS